MLYYVFRFLEQYNIPGSHLWSYISFRSLLALILALCVSAWFGEYFIKYMRRKKIYETERDPLIDPFGEQKKGVAAQVQEDLTSNAKAQKDFMILASNTMSPEAYGKMA